MSDVKKCVKNAGCEVGIYNDDETGDTFDNDESDLNVERQRQGHRL